MSVAANKPFHWPMGMQLRARSAIVVAVPAEILIEGESLGAIVEISNDNTRIAFQEAVESVGGFSAILIELQSGASLRLNRSAEAVALGSSSEEVVFDVM